MIEKKVLIQYKRKSRRRPYGVVVAIDRNIIGWSICHKNDIFLKDIAVEIALERAYKLKSMNIMDDDELDSFYKKTIPESLVNLAITMLERSRSYYK